MGPHPKRRAPPSPGPAPRSPLHLAGPPPLTCSVVLPASPPRYAGKLRQYTGNQIVVFLWRLLK